MELKSTVNGVLTDMLTMLEAEAKAAGKEGLALLEQATALTKPVMSLSGEAQLRGLESIGHGLKSGLAAIANEKARSMLDSLLTRSLNFASTIAQAGLGMLGKLVG